MLIFESKIEQTKGTATPTELCTELMKRIKTRDRLDYMDLSHVSQKKKHELIWFMISETTTTV